MIALAVLLALAVLQFAFLHFRYGERGLDAEVSFAVSDDGARLALYRYRPASPAAGREPVLMISGFGLNRAAIDFDGRLSWARGFARAGFDTWILELRRSGRSGSAGGRDGSFDDYTRDTAAALAHVLERTGAEKAHWVGYSLGGMLLYAALGTGAAGLIRSAVAVEAPATLSGYPLDRPSAALLRLLERVPGLHRIPYRFFTRLGLPWMPLLYGTPMFTAWINPENIDRALMRKILYRTIDDVPLALAVQFRQWIGSEGLRSLDGKTDYLAGLAESRVPVLVMTGRAGEFSARAKLALARLKGETRWLELTRAQGYSADYGHADLVLGLRAPEEVFLHALEWLSRHQAPSADSRAIT